MPATLAPAMRCLLLQKYAKKLVGTKAEESFAPDLAAACIMNLELCCLPAGLILQAAPHPHSIPLETLETASPFL